MKNHPSDEDYRIAVIAGWCWLAVVVLSLLCSCAAQGASAVTAGDLEPAVCRITNQLNGVVNVGSGTLIDKTEEGREGLVLTCAHLFREGVGEVLVRFADGKTHRAKLIDVSHEADLAALAIARPRSEPAGIVFELEDPKKLHACGYGARGVYRCAVGPVVGQAASAGQMSLLIGDGVRSGDSGGGVFDEQGRLVAVIWGEAQGVTYASYGKPLRQFLGRVLGLRTGAVYACPGGVCPDQPPVVRRPVRERPERPAFPLRGGVAGLDSRWEEFQKQLNELRAVKQDRGDYLTRDELPNFESYARRADVRRVESEVATRHASLLERLQTLSGRSVGKAAGTAAVGLLGLSGPAGWAVIAGASVGGWLIGRRMKRKLRGAGGRRRRRFRE